MLHIPNIFPPFRHPKALAADSCSQDYNHQYLSYSMAEYVSLYTSTIHRRSLSDTFSEFRQTYEGQDQLNLLYNYPADINIIGEMHRHNTDFGFKEVSSAQKEIGCPCCKTQYKTYEKDLNVGLVHTTPTQEEIAKMNKGEMDYRIGSEVVAFFTQIKILILSLVIRFIIFDFTQFIKAYYYSGEYYSRNQLTKDGHLVDEDYILNAKLKFSAKVIVAYYKYDIVAFQLLALVIIMIVFFTLSHRFQLSLFQSIEIAMPNQSRYAVLVENIPLIPMVAGYEQARFQNMAYEKRLKLYFKKYIKDHFLLKLRGHIENSQLSKEGLTKMQKELLEHFNRNNEKNFTKIQEQIVQDIVICYENSCLTRLQREKEFLMSRYLNHPTESKTQRENYKAFTLNSLKKLNKYHLKTINYFNTTNTLNQKMPYFLGFAFVVFNYQIYRDFLIKDAIEQQGKQRMNDTNDLVIRAAEKPSVVEWNHFMQRKQEQLRTRIYTNSILIIILLITLVMLSYLEMYKIIPMIEKWLHFPKRYQHRIKIIIISGITSLINLLLSTIIQILANSEKRLSKTGTAISLLTKNVITQFFNSALIYYIITFVTPASFLFQMKDLKQKIESLIIIPGIIRILINFLNAKYIFKKFQFQFYSSNNFQIEFNKLYERPEFDMVNKYAYYIVQILTVSFYAPLTPMIIPALTLILPVVYYVDKLVLFKKSSQPAKISFRVTDWVHFLCECSLLSFIIGWLLFCPEELWSQFVEVVSYLCLFIIIGYLSYRFKTLSQYERYFPKMNKSSKSHTQCDTIMAERYKNYDPWKCYLKTTPKTQSGVNFPFIKATTEQIIQ